MSYFTKRVYTEDNIRNDWSNQQIIIDEETGNIQVKRYYYSGFGFYMLFYTHIGSGLYILDDWDI